MQLKLPNTVSSAQDIQALIIEVKEYAKWHAHAAIKERVDVKSNTAAPLVSPAATEVISALGKGKAVSPQNISDSIGDLIADLEEYRDTATQITITLAAPATNEIKHKLTTWCRENISLTALVSFKFNSTLLGGMVVRHGSRIFDWSFRRQILNSRANFAEALHNVR